MMKRAVLVIGFLLAACSQSAGPMAGVASPSPSPSPVATATPAVVAVSQLPLTTVDFYCRLPVVVGDAGGFIKFPAGTFTPDPNGVLQPQPSGTYAIDGNPKLFGVTWQMYDVAQRRWVPTDPDHMAPDGRFYAYAVGNSVHVVDVASGADTVSVVALPGADSQRVRVADFDSAGVDLLADEPDLYPSGVWAMNQTNGDVRLLK